MKSIIRTFGPQSVFRKLALGAVLITILALFIGGQQGAPRGLQSTTEQNIFKQNLAQLPVTVAARTGIEIGGQKVPGSGVPLNYLCDSDHAQIGTIDLTLFEAVNGSMLAKSIYNIAARASAANHAEIGGPSTGTTMPKPTLPFQMGGKGDIGGPGNQGIPRGHSDGHFDIEGQQNAPRAVAEATTISSITTSAYDEYN
ncbi:MAG TPA: hypothetical protein VGB71_05275 [Flavisolibacter sp.]